MCACVCGHLHGLSGLSVLLPSGGQVLQANKNTVLGLNPPADARCTLLYTGQSTPRGGWYVAGGGGFGFSGDRMVQLQSRKWACLGNDETSDASTACLRMHAVHPPIYTGIQDVSAVFKNPPGCRSGWWDPQCGPMIGPCHSSDGLAGWPLHSFATLTCQPQRLGAILWIDDFSDASNEICTTHKLPPFSLPEHTCQFLLPSHSFALHPFTCLPSLLMQPVAPNYLLLLGGVGSIHIHDTPGAN